jgi:hypothetical protein
MTTKNNFVATNFFKIMTEMFLGKNLKFSIIISMVDTKPWSIEWLKIFGK